MDDFFNAIRKEISIVKGDTLAFNFQLQGLNGVDPDEIALTCRDKPEDNDYNFKVYKGHGITRTSYNAEDDTLTYSVRVPPASTNIVAGRYYYDLEINVNGEVITLMRGRLNVEWDVTRGVINE